MSTAALSWAVRLALDVETCRDVLNGTPVDRARLDPQALARAEALRLLRLDFHAIDLFEQPLGEYVPIGTEALAQLLRETDPRRFDVGEQREAA